MRTAKWKRVLAVILSVTLVFSNGMITEAAENDAQPTSEQCEVLSQEAAKDEKALQQPESVVETVAASSGTCGENLTWTLDNNGTFIVDGTGNMADYSDGWDSIKESIKKVIIKSGVTSIGAWTFSLCKNLESVEIADSVTEIGIAAFNYCTNLKNVKIGNGVTILKSAAFRGCTSLTGIELPDSLITLEDSVFEDSGLISIVLPKGVTEIGEQVFLDIETLTSIEVDEANTVFSSMDGILYNKNKTTLILCPRKKSGEIKVPEGVKNLEKEAFCMCEMSSVVLPSTLETIGSNTFNACTNIEEIKIPEGVVTIEAGAFAGCDALKKVTIPKSVTSIGNKVFNGTYNALIYCYKNSAGHTYAIENELIFFLLDQKIQAQGNCGENLTWVLENVDGSGVLKISGTGAMKDWDIRTLWDKYPNLPEWYDIRKLISKIEIQDGVTSIGEYAFYDCTNITDITLAESVTYIGMSAFEYCSSITDIKLAESVTGIGVAAFAYCSSLKEIKLPSKLDNLATATFKGCSSLTSIEIPESVWSLSGNLFEDCTSLSYIKLPKEMGNIYWEVFKNCSSLTSIEIPDNVKEIGYSAFEGCNQLTTITLPDTINKIDSYAFKDCSSLTSIELPENVRGFEIILGSGIFQNCSNLKTVKIHNTNLRIGDNLFDGCEKVTVYCYKDSPIYTYVVEHKIPYKLLNKSVSKASVKLSASTYYYNGKSHKPTVTVKLNGKKLTKDTDYTVKYKNNKKIGTATVTITGKGKYSGSIKKNYKITVKKGASYTVGSYKYKITSSSTVAFAGLKSSKSTKVTIPNTVEIGGKSFKVTSIAAKALYKKTKVKSVIIGANVTTIGKEAFRNCSKLSSITIKSTKLKSVGKNALKGIKSTAKIKVPKKKFSAYKKLLKGKGQSSKVRIVKN